MEDWATCQQKLFFTHLRPTVPRLHWNTSGRVGCPPPRGSHQHVQKCALRSMPEPPLAALRHLSLGSGAAPLSAGPHWFSLKMQRIQGRMMRRLTLVGPGLLPSRHCSPELNSLHPQDSRAPSSRLPIGRRAQTPAEVQGRFQNQQQPGEASAGPLCSFFAACSSWPGC